MALSILFWIILVTVLDGLLALTGAFSFLLSKKFFNKTLIVLVAFSVGALLGGALFHLLPESLNSLELTKTIILFILGIILFLVLEKLIHWRHCHEPDCKIHPYSYLILYGDAMHNFIDGLLIAGSFLVSIPIGIVTSILVIAHELPQEIGYFGVLVHGGFSKKKALSFNLLSQLTAVIGGLAGYFLLSLTKYSAYLLPIAAGGFIYIAIQDLIPEVLKEKDNKKRIINLIAVILGFLLLLSAKLFAG
ncbi:MAG: ZIP family metal transporter [Candidatus Nanoarchaeia archaeon]|nr:ZIP family metal transporter [Candidatus Nanoarchaeia archaeon]MDD5740777.1 ZIP family metal transporter [Candidatus Nanoarchaeia archaeon]